MQSRGKIGRPQFSPAEPKAHNDELEPSSVHPSLRASVQTFKSRKLTVMSSSRRPFILPCVRLFKLSNMNISETSRPIAIICCYELHSRSRKCTPFTRIIRVKRAYYARNAIYAHSRVTYAHLRVTYLINIHKQ